MNKTIDFKNLGGLPFDSDTLDFMQKGYVGALDALAKVIGNNVIVYGLEPNNNEITPGWIVYGGELIPFVGGVKLQTFIVEEIAERRTFFDGQEHEVYFTKQARFASGGIDFNSLKRVDNVFKQQQSIIDNNKTQSDAIASLNKTIEDLKINFLPYGVPVAYAGYTVKIPSGWALCDGRELARAEYSGLFAAIGDLHGGNGTTTFRLPDLRGQFIVGYNKDDADYSAIGKKGGEKAHILTIEEMPSHTHAIKRGDSYGGNGDQKGGYVGGGQSGNQQTDAISRSEGAGKPHETRPPYYTLAYIIKL